MTRTELIWYYISAALLGVCIGVLVYVWIYG